MNYPQGQGPQKKPGMSPLAIVGIVIACVFSGCVVCVGVAFHKSPAEKAADEADRKKYEGIAAASASADKAAHDLAEKQLQTACKSKSARVPDEVDVKVACQAEAKARALSPKSVDFPGIFDPDGKVITSGCSITYVSWLDAKNAFNATIRTNYRCTFNPVTQRPSIEILR